MISVKMWLAFMNTVINLLVLIYNQVNVYADIAEAKDSVAYFRENFQAEIERQNDIEKQKICSKKENLMKYYCSVYDGRSDKKERRFLTESEIVELRRSGYYVTILDD